MVAAVFGVNYFSLAVNAFMRSGSWGLSRSRASALRRRGHPLVFKTRDVPSAKIIISDLNGPTFKSLRIYFFQYMKRPRTVS